MSDIDDILLCLSEWFPAAFAAERHQPHRPLKIGISRDLAEHCPALQPHEIAAALRAYTGRLLYLEALTREGEPRIDLDGQSVGAVTAAEAAYAALQFAMRLAKREAAWAAAKAEREARREALKAARKAEPPVAPPIAPPRRPILSLKART